MQNTFRLPPNIVLSDLTNIPCGNILVHDLLHRSYDDAKLAFIIACFDQRLLGNIIIFKDKNTNDELYVIDGHHRLAACRSVGVSHIRAQVITEDKAFLFYAYEMMHLGASKHLCQITRHNNALIRHELGSRTPFDIESMQVSKVLNRLKISLADSRSGHVPSYYFSNRKAAGIAYQVDGTGELLAVLLSVIKEVFPSEPKVDDRIFKGLLDVFFEKKEEIAGAEESFFVDLLSKCTHTSRTTRLLLEEAKDFWKSNYREEWTVRKGMKQYFLYRHERSLD